MSTHVAILLRPYINLILTGRKTVESRLTVRPLPPFAQITAGDRIYFKASAGPYLATAMAQSVFFFAKLTPARVRRLRVRFNAAVCGEAAYWQKKRCSRYATFITLCDIQPTTTGPKLAPSNGLAWFVLPAPEPLPTTLVPAGAPLAIPLTAGAIRNRYLRIRQLPSGRIRLVLPDAKVIPTDLTDRHMIRWRGWGGYYQQHALRPQDVVALVPLADRQYRVVFHRQNPIPSAE